MRCEVVEGRVAAVVHVVCGVVDSEEDEEMHGTEINQHEAITRHTCYKRESRGMTSLTSCLRCSG